MTWNINDKFNVSGIAELPTHCPAVHTTGVITALLKHNKARVILADVKGEKNIEAIIKLRDLRPIRQKRQ